MKVVVFGFIALLFSIGMITPSFAHTTVEVGEYKIEVGWGIEPPVVGIRNDIVFKITEPGENEGTYKGITSVFKNLEATAMYGGATKKIDINSDPRPGYYFSPVIPTKTGSYIIDMKGEISGTLVDVQIPVEDVEPTAVLDFPPTSGPNDTDINALKQAIVSMQQDIRDLQNNTPSNGGTSYDFAILSISLSVAAIIISIIFASTHNAKRQQMSMIKMAEKLKLSEQQLDDLRRILEKENRERDS